MSAKAIREATGKDILNRYLSSKVPEIFTPAQFASVDPDTQWGKVEQDNPWVNQKALVAKPDQLIKRRGKLGLITVNKKFPEVKTWINDRMDKDTTVRIVI